MIERMIDVKLPLTERKLNDVTLEMSSRFQINKHLSNSVL